MFEGFHTMAKEARKMSMNKLIKTALKDKDLQDEIVRMNTQDQLYEEGIDSKGLKLGDYSNATIYGIPGKFEGKIEKGDRYDHITLHGDGDFYDSFKVKPEENSAVIEADTQKGGKGTKYNFDSDARGNPVLASKVRERSTDLQQEFGKDILGLTDENMGYVVAEVKISVQEQIRKKLFT